MKHNFIENELIILTKQTLDVFLKQDNPSELISLYTFYYYTAKWQMTNQPKCTTDYVAKGLHWSKNKVIKVKKQLLEFGLIEDVRLVDDKTKKVQGYYIKMNYIFKKTTLSNNQCTQNPHTGYENQKASLPEIEGVESEHTNALSANNINALSANNKVSKEEPQKKSFNEIIEGYTDNEELRSELKEYLKTRKLKKAALTNRAIELSLEKLDSLANTDKEKILIVRQSIMCGYAEFFELKGRNNNRNCNQPEEASPSYDISEYENYSVFEEENWEQNFIG